jgi:pyruvate dehydrogenase E1 component alpha subunit
MVGGHDDVALAFFGDGATSEGEAHEALNVAGVMKAPVVFLCVNNQWAISTPVSRQTAAKQLVDKAIGYGIPGERVDGFDVIEVAESLGRAVERARNGNGPSFIEAFCYRIGPHATADDPSLYRSSVDEEHWRSMEPIGRMEESLIREGLLSYSQAKAYKEAVRTTMLEAARRLDRLPRPDRSWLGKGTFASEVFIGGLTGEEVLS